MTTQAETWHHLQVFRMENSRINYLEYLHAVLISMLKLGYLI